MPLFGTGITYSTYKTKVIIYFFGLLVILSMGIYGRTNLLAGDIEESINYPINRGRTHSGTQALEKPKFHLYIHGSGKISGFTKYKEQTHIPEKFHVCAETFNASERYCVNKFSKVDSRGAYAFTIDVPIGQYYVYSGVTGENYKAYYDEFVQCGMKKSCANKGLLPVKVLKGQTVDNILPINWFQP